MIFLNQPASRKASHLLDHFIYYKGYMPDHSKERIVPDETVSLIFELDGHPRFIYDNESLKEKQMQERAWVSGFKREYITISAHVDSEMLVARFRVGGGRPVLQRAVDEISNKVVPAEEVFGPAVFDLRHELIAKEGGAEKIAHLEKWLLARANNDLAAPPSVKDAIDQLLANPYLADDNLQGIIKTSKYSRKQFIHHFKTNVGTTPKYFQRTLRFSGVLRLIHNKEEVDWIKVIEDCGYFDQAHFIRDFTAFSGVNPSDFIKQFNEQVNFFPLDKKKGK